MCHRDLTPTTGGQVMSDSNNPESQAASWRECPNATALAQALNVTVVTEVRAHGYSSEELLWGVIFYLAQVMGTMEVEPHQIWETLAANVEVYKKAAQEDRMVHGGLTGIPDGETRH